jgi:hypothetical protein
MIPLTTDYMTSSGRVTMSNVLEGNVHGAVSGRYWHLHGESVNYKNPESVHRCSGRYPSRVPL